MIKKTIPFVLLLFSALLMPAQNKAVYIIDGQITGIKDGVIVNLSDYHGQTIFAADTITNGKFKLIYRNESGDTIPVKLALFKDNVPFVARDLWIAPQAVTHITGKGYNTEIWNVVNNLPQQLELNRYTAAGGEHLKQLQQSTNNLIHLYYSLMDNDLPENESGELKNKYLLTRDTVFNLADSVFKKELTIMRDWKDGDVLFNKMTEYAVMYINDRAYSQVAELRNIYESLPANTMNISLKSKLKKTLWPIATDLIGEQAFDKPMPDMDGNKHTLAEFRGKFLLLDFWASWCGPCMKAVPEVKKAHETYKDKLTVAGINLDERDADWLQASQRHGITWQNLHDAGGFGKSLHKQYGGSSIPYYVLISPEGTILDIWAGYLPGDLLKRLEAYIK